MGWDEYFINIAEVVATKSKDVSTKTGTVIVDENHRPVSFGYNGFVSGVDEEKMSQERPMRYYVSIHAEMNAILFAKRDLTNCSLYSLYAPCENCLKHILQAGIKKIIYKKAFVESKLQGASKSMSTTDTDEAIFRMLSGMPDVECRNINGKTYLEEIFGDDLPKI